MSSSNALSPIAETDYEAIESAVMETQRGRWFLAEYARRNRNADTSVLLEAIGRLENAVSRERETQRLDRLRFDLVEMARAITATKREIATIRPSEGTPSDLEVASEALDGIVRTTERATSDILEAAEHVQEAAWTLREDGARDDLCDELDRRATDIYTHCSFQDLTAQRTRRIVETLRFLEGRIDAMMDIWGASLDDDAPAEPRREGLGAELKVFDGLGQSEIDDVIVESRLAEPDCAGEEVVAVVEPDIGAGVPMLDGGADEVAWDEAMSDELTWSEIASDEAPALDAAVEVVEVETANAAPDAIVAEAKAESEAGEEAEPEADAMPAFSAEAFAEIDALSTREKLARFS